MIINSHPRLLNHIKYIDVGITKNNSLKDKTAKNMLLVIYIFKFGS